MAIALAMGAPNFDYMSSDNMKPGNGIKAALFVVMVILSTLFSWYSPLDHPAENYINESIKNAGLIYASARAINAAVSVAQSANLGVGVSVTIGELLDPINDLIERFSAAMEISITSLAMQKVLLLSVKHDVFNILLTITGIVFLISLIIGRYSEPTFKVFAILFFIRMSLSMVLLANFTVDKLFLEEELKSGQKDIELFQKEAAAFTGRISNSEMDRMPSILEQLSDVKTKKNNLQREIVNLSNKTSELEISLDQAREKRSWWDINLLTNDPEALRIEKELEAIEASIEEKQGQIEATDIGVEALQKDLACIKKRNQGDSCSWKEKWQKITSKFDLSVLQASDTMNSNIDNLLSLMALVILKSIIFPILFWLLVYKLAKAVWNRKFTLWQSSPFPTTIQVND